MDIRVATLVTGQTCVFELIEEHENHYTVKSPYFLIPTSDTGITPVPAILFKKPDEESSLNKSSLAFKEIFEPPMEVCNNFRELTGAVVLAEKPIIATTK